MAHYNGNKIVYTHIDFIDEYDTGSDEDNIGWQILDLARKYIAEGEEKLGITCSGYNFVFYPSNHKESFTLVVNILEDDSSLLLIGVPDLVKSFRDLYVNEIKEKLMNDKGD